MITLTAEIKVKGKNPYPFKIGETPIGTLSMFGESVNAQVDLNKRNTISIESKTEDRGDITVPSYGIVSNGGSLSFKDNKQRFLNYADAGVLADGQEIKIFVENKQKKAKQQVGVYYSTDWDYDNNNRAVSVSFKDRLEEWQEIYIDEIPLSSSSEKLNMYHFFNILREKAESRGFVFLVDDSAIESMSKTEGETLYMEKGTLWGNFSKICEICSLYIYQNRDGKVFVFSDLS